MRISNKERIEDLEDNLRSSDRMVNKIKKTLSILLEHLEKTSPNGEKAPFEVLKKALKYWG